jgi:hypothetical protein
MNIDLVLFILAVVLFCLDGFRVAASVNFVSLAFACITLTFIL